MENCAYFVLESLQRDPEKTILVVDDEAITCKQFQSRVTGIANLLKDASLRPGDRVFLTVTPSIDLFCTVVAIFAVGGTVIVLDPRVGMERFEYCIAKARPAMWVWLKGSKFKWLKYVFPSIKAIPNHVEIGPTPDTRDLLQPEEVVTAEHALISFTTGSTGMPKLLLRQHSFILLQSKSLSTSYDKGAKQLLKIEEENSSMCTNLVLFPLHNLKIGSTAVYISKFATCQPSKVIDTLRKYNVTSLAGSPAFVHRIARYAIKEHIMLPIKLTVVGGAPLFRHIVRDIVSVTPNKDMLIAYGSTEVEPVSFITAKEKMTLEESKPDGLCVGRPLFDYSVKIIKIQDESQVFNVPVDVRKLELPSGEIGEVIVSGWHVNTHQVEAKRLIPDKNGVVWLRIEDAGYMDRNGRLWLVGRVKWRVHDIKSGLTFWSTVVEQKILERTSKITFVSYLNHENESYLFIEAPDGLPAKEQQALESFIKTEGIPVDNLIIKPFIAKDRRHASKPNTAVLFGNTTSSWNETLLIIKFIVINNSIAVFLFVTIFLLLLLLVLINL